VAEEITMRTHSAGTRLGSGEHLRNSTSVQT
jgi:hypothetical protein